MTMRRRWILRVVLGFAVAGLALEQTFRGFSVDSRRQVTLISIGTTNVSNGGQLGDGTSEFPRLEFAKLGLVHPSGRWRLELFRLTNGTRFDALVGSESLEIWSSNRWVPSVPANGITALYTPPPVLPGKTTIIPVPIPETGQPWRVRFGVQESARGLKARIDQFTVKWLHRIFFPGRHLEVVALSAESTKAGPGAVPAGQQRIP